MGRDDAASRADVAATVARLVRNNGAGAEDIVSEGGVGQGLDAADAYAVGFVAGAARAMEMTPVELVDSLGLTFEPAPATRARGRRRRAPGAAAAILAAAIALAAAAARAGDAIPFFRPDAAPAVPYGPKLADPIATECAADDAQCIAEHESRVLALALDTRDRTWCAHASDAPRCELLYDFVVEGAPAPPPPLPDPTLTDPCTFVVKVDAGKATLYTRAHRTKVVPNQGWRAARFLGTCDLGALEQHVEDGIQALPAFPWAGAAAAKR